MKKTDETDPIKFHSIDQGIIDAGNELTQNLIKNTVKLTIGEYADYFDTGIWTFKDGHCEAPDDLTIAQLKDHLTACGGAVYLRKDGKLCWINTR